MFFYTDIYLKNILGVNIAENNVLFNQIISEIYNVRLIKTKIKVLYKVFSDDNITVNHEKN